MKMSRERERERERERNREWWDTVTNIIVFGGFQGLEDTAGIDALVRF